jgi:hypothetical protein
VTPRDDLRDLIVSLLHDYPSAHEIADRLINAGLVDASNAREGWLVECPGYAELWPLGVRASGNQRVLVIPAKDAS